VTGNKSPVSDKLDFGYFYQVVRVRCQYPWPWKRKIGDPSMSWNTCIKVMLKQFVLHSDKWTLQRFVMFPWSFTSLKSQNWLQCCHLCVTVEMVWVGISRDLSVPRYETERERDSFCWHFPCKFKSQEMINEESHISRLPNEVMEFILSLVSPYKDLESCKLVCRKWLDTVRSK
jgi:F-box-like